MILRTVEQVRCLPLPQASNQSQSLAAERLLCLPKVSAVVRRDEHESRVGVILHALCEGRNELYAVERQAARGVQFLFQNFADCLEFSHCGGRILHCDRLKWSAGGEPQARRRLQPVFQKARIPIQMERTPSRNFFLAQMFDGRIKERKISEVAQIQVRNTLRRGPAPLPGMVLQLSRRVGIENQFSLPRILAKLLEYRIDLAGGRGHGI